jgi:antitoxin component YwqK of YwqJK toxin-antitoxin module
MQEEQLAGQYLKLRRQSQPISSPQVVATALPRRPFRPPKFGSYGMGGMAGSANPKANFVYEGKWQLLNERDETIVAGRYHADKPHGRWTVYHANGRIAAQGEMLQGLRTGLWRTWNDAGQLQSEVTYVVANTALPRPAGLQGSLPFGGIGSTGLPSAVGTGQLRSGVTSKTPLTIEISRRHGPARLWHPNGQLQCEGVYERDLHEGQWSFYDAQGRLCERGDYRRGLREGSWLIHDAGTGQSTIVEYFADRPRDEYDRLVADLKQEIASGELERQIFAMHRLDELGLAALPLLAALLDDTSDDVKTMARRRLELLHRESQQAAEPAPLRVN